MQIRLFGDPRHSDSEIPQLSVTISVDVEQPGEIPLPVARAESHDVACDFVGGWAFGDAIGVGLRSVDDWWTVTAVEASASLSEVRTHVSHCDVPPEL